MNSMKKVMQTKENAERKQRIMQKESKGESKKKGGG